MRKNVQSYSFFLKYASFIVLFYPLHRIRQKKTPRKVSFVSSQGLEPWTH